MKVIVKAAILICTLALTGAILAETLDSKNDIPFEQSERRNNFWENTLKGWVDHDDNPPQTLLGFDKMTFSGFGGPIASTSIIDGQNHYFTGARGGAIFNDFLVIGGGGYGLVYPYKRTDFTNQAYQGDFDNIHMGYGGLLFGFHFFQKSIINFSLLTIVGAGGITATRNWSDGDNDQDSDQDSDEHRANSSAFFVCEPTAMVHMNIARWLRIGGGVSYRYTKGMDLDEFSDNDFDNISIVVSIEGGWF